mgnify:CR=1 FL=1|jgi:hypothetical protein
MFVPAVFLGKYTIDCDQIDQARSYPIKLAIVHQYARDLFLVPGGLIANHANKVIDLIDELFFVLLVALELVSPDITTVDGTCVGILDSVHTLFQVQGLCNRLNVISKCLEEDIVGVVCGASEIPRHILGGDELSVEVVAVSLLEILKERVNVVLADETRACSAKAVEYQSFVKFRALVQKLHDNVAVAFFVESEQRLELVLEEEKDLLADCLRVPVLEELLELEPLHFWIVRGCVLAERHKESVEVWTVLQTELLSLGEYLVPLGGDTGCSVVAQLEGNEPLGLCQAEHLWNVRMAGGCWPPK